MKAHDKEFEEMRNAFENTVKNKETRFYFPNLTRSSRDFKSSFYENGTTDMYFQMFMQGYEFSKTIQRLNE